jgi:hypothetical protein
MPPKQSWQRGAKGKGAAAAGAGAAPKPALALPSTPAELENVLAASQSNDNAAIAAATEVLMAFLKVPQALPSLLQQIQQSQIAASRQMAAVLLRKCIVKLFKALKPQEKDEVVSATQRICAGEYAVLRQTEAVGCAVTCAHRSPVAVGCARVPHAPLHRLHCAVPSAREQRLNRIVSDCVVIVSVHPFVYVSRSACCCSSCWTSPSASCVIRSAR